MLSREEFAALHRHWMWANVIKSHFDNAIADAKRRGVSSSPEQLFPEPFGAYMSIYYGMLYGLLEVLKENGVSIPKIQGDIDSIFDNLRLYRNAVFHPQPKYWSPKFFEIMKDRDSAIKIGNVHAGVGEFFLDELGRLNSGQPGLYVR